MLSEMISECEGLEDSLNDGSADWDWESHLAEIARESTSNLEDLVKTYYKAEVSMYKIRLGDTLLLLNYREIIPDLIKTLNCKNNFFEYLTALTLIGFNEEIGGQHLINVHDKDPVNYNYESIHHDLYLYKTEVAIKYHTIFSKLDMAEKQSLKATES